MLVSADIAPGSRSEAMSLIAKKIRVELGGKTIINNVDFRADEGQLIGILGPSGCGKSTLLRALSGFRPATAGTVRLEGEDLYANFNDLKMQIGYVPQDDVVPLSLKVERVLLYSAELRLAGEPPDIRKGRVSGVIQKLGLAKSRNQRVSKLSGGQRKRVSVGIELLTRPSILFADEPTSGLDPALERSLTQVLSGLTKDGSIVIVTTHIMSSLDLLDRVCVLSAGRLVFFGEVSELKPFFEVEDYIDIYTKLQSRSAEAWQNAFQQSGLAAKYL
ncbi:MAG: ABC transporter ATP-binding protein [Bradymonadaceae bacterium]